MKRFLSRTIWFIVPVLLLAYPLDWFFSRMLLQGHDPTGELEVVHDIYERKIDAKLAVYGSSRAWVHFNSQMIEDSLKLPSYNFGIDGHNFWLQYLRHLEYIKHNPKPSVIVLSVDVFSMQRRHDLYQSGQFLPSMLWNQDIYHYTHDYEGFSFYDYWVPLIRYAGKKEAFKEIGNVLNNNTQQPLRHKGFAGMDLNWDKSVDAKLAGQKKYNIRFDAATLKLFENFLLQCQKDRIKVVLVYCPEFIKGQHFVANRAQLMQYYRQVSQQYKVAFFDFSDDPICRQKSLFYNASHLNKTGADLFTQKLIAQLRPLLVKDQSDETADNLENNLPISAPNR